MNLLLFLAALFLATYLLGRLLEKIRIPWVFSALLIGLGLAAYNPFFDITHSPSFTFLAELGMFFLLFIIGFELNLHSIFKSSKFIVKTTYVMILAETIVGTFLVHYVFGVQWFISFLVSASFATVGEEILLPILEEFKLLKTKLGQTIMGIGVLDDVIEVLTVLIASVVIGNSLGYTQTNIWFNIFALVIIFGLFILFLQYHKHLARFQYKDIPASFILVVFIIFLFVGLGRLAESAALGALLAGITVRHIIPSRIINIIESEMKTLSYGFFAPIFFCWVGLDTDVAFLIKYPLLILLVMAMTNSTKILSSYLMGRKELGPKKSIIMGISLSVKFSTSIVIIKLLFEKGLITADLYSVLIGTTILFKFVIPFALAYLIPRWKIATSKNI
mgnify:CR=1 FL=1